MTNEERKNEIKDELINLKQELADKQDELDNLDLTESYDEMLDEYEVKIGNLEYLGSRVLKEIDPIAYNCGYSDYEDEQRSELESEVEDLQRQIEELETELEEL